MKHSRERLERVNAQSKECIVNLPVYVVEWIATEARKRNSTSEELMEEIITATVNKEAEPLPDRLRRVNQLIKRLVRLGFETTTWEAQETERSRGQVSIASKLPPSFDERRKRRDRLLELGMEAYEELKQISSSE